MNEYVNYWFKTIIRIEWIILIDLCNYVLIKLLASILRKFYYYSFKTKLILKFKFICYYKKFQSINTFLLNQSLIVHRCVTIYYDQRSVNIGVWIQL